MYCLRTIFVTILWFTILTRDTGAIINGILGTQLMFNYMVSVWDLHDFMCGGSILDRTHILTAAHCVYGNLCPEAYTIQAGTTHWFSSAVISRVRNIRIHPNYTNIDGHQLNDVAVLTLRDPLEYSTVIHNVTLPNPGGTLPYCAMCRIAGWGPTDLENEIPSPGLHYAKFSILPPEDCRNNTPDIRQNELCARDPRRSATTATGDSGGPLVCDGIIYGVHSDGCCDPADPVIMVNVIEQLSFIREAQQN